VDRGISGLMSAMPSNALLVECVRTGHIAFGVRSSPWPGVNRALSVKLVRSRVRPRLQRPLLRPGIWQGRRRSNASPKGDRFPDLTVPAGFATDALPVGIEFMGRPFAEGSLLKLGCAYAQATLKRRPPLITPALPGEP
jgi:hypothetical protein